MARIGNFSVSWRMSQDMETTMVRKYYILIWNICLFPFLKHLPVLNGHKLLLFQMFEILLDLKERRKSIAICKYINPHDSCYSYNHWHRHFYDHSVKWCQMTLMLSNYWPRPTFLANVGGLFSSRSLGKSGWLVPTRCYLMEIKVRSLMWNEQCNYSWAMTPRPRVLR